MGQGYSLMPQLGRQGLFRDASISAIEMTINFTGLPENHSKTNGVENSGGDKPRNATDDQKSDSHRGQKFSEGLRPTAETSLEEHPTKTELNGLVGISNGAITKSENDSSDPSKNCGDVTMTTGSKLTREGLREDSRPQPEGAVSPTMESQYDRDFNLKWDLLADKTVSNSLLFDLSKNENTAKPSHQLEKFFESSGKDHLETNHGNDPDGKNDEMAKPLVSVPQNQMQTNRKDGSEPVKDPQKRTQKPRSSDMVIPPRRGKENTTRGEKSQESFGRQMERQRNRGTGSRNSLKSCPPSLVNFSTGKATEGLGSSLDAGPSIPNALETKLRANLERMLIKELQGKLSGDEGGMIKGDTKIKDVGKIKGGGGKIKDGTKADVKGARHRDRDKIGGLNKFIWRLNRPTDTGDGYPEDLAVVNQTGEDEERKQGKNSGSRSTTTSAERSMTSSSKTGSRNDVRNKNVERHIINGVNDDSDGGGGGDDGDFRGQTTRQQHKSNNNNEQRRGSLNSKEMVFRLDDTSSCSTEVTSNSLQRSIVRELLDGEIEIRRSNCLFQNPVPDDLQMTRPRQSSKPLVAMLQPRKVQGVRVLPPPTTPGPDGHKYRALKSGFSSCPKRSRNIQRAPAIRSPRHPTQESNPSHEFQRVGMRLRGTGRLSGRREGLIGEARYSGKGKRARMRQGGKGKPGENWKTMSKSGSSEIREEVNKMGFSSSPVERFTKENLLQSKKKDAEIAALLQQVQNEDLEEEGGNSECDKNTPNSRHIDFETSLGYFP